jgi:lipocalin
MRFLIVLFLLFPAVVAACAGGGRGRDLPPLATVSRVDLDRYLGTWYEIARLPNRFEKGCVGTTAFYEKEDYRWAVVGDPSSRYLWFLARTPVMDETTYSNLVALARAAGFDTDRLERPEQFPDRSPER